jgi:bacterioferritin
MSITRDQVIKELNKDLEWEYAAAVQYVQHAAVISGAQYEGVQKELIIHSQEEMAHAVLLSEQINFLGGTPAVDVEKRAVSDDSRTMLQQDLRGEEEAIRRYHERIEQAEALKLYGLRRVLEDILIQEEEHKRDLSMALAS